MNKAIKYRLYPNSEQEIMFLKTFGCCRKIYNLMLADKISSYGLTKSFGKHTPAMYKNDYPFLSEVDSLALANVQLNLQSALRNCFDKNRKTRNGFPKFKSSKHNRKSYTTNNQHGTVSIIENRYIKLPKIGRVKAVIHRVPDDNWHIKSVTISMDSDGKYYASILFEYESDVKQIELNKDSKSLGLDYASDGLYVDDKGNKGSNHKYYRESHNKLAKAQRKLSRMVGSKRNETKSNNYLKQLKKINRVYKHITNQRLDNLHKLSAKIANSVDVVCVEDLNMKSLSNKSFHNGLATLDNGYGLFLNLLEYKLEERGKHFIKVDKWYPSSQICSGCGKTHKEMKDLAKRVMRCDCGFIMNRDHNAAINIKNEGLRLLSNPS